MRSHQPLVKGGESEQIPPTAIHKTSEYEYEFHFNRLLWLKLLEIGYHKSRRLSRGLRKKQHFCVANKSDHISGKIFEGQRWRRIKP